MESCEVRFRSEVMALAPAARISLATCSFSSSSGDATTMSQPARQSASAVARPMPRLEPVTNATRSDIVLLRNLLAKLNHSKKEEPPHHYFMAYTDLRDFIRALEKNGELKRISLEVDPILEITEFADRAVKQGGPALLFENPKGYRIPVLINAYASARKMEIALETDSVD